MAKNSAGQKPPLSRASPKTLCTHVHFEWKINWLQTCDDCRKHEPPKNGVTAKYCAPLIILTSCFPLTLRIIEREVLSLQPRPFIIQPTVTLPIFLFRWA